LHCRNKATPSVAGGDWSFRNIGLVHESYREGRLSTIEGYG
jgi:hypothetical protein